MRGKSKQQTFIKTPSLLQTPRPDTAPTCSLLRHASLHMPLSMPLSPLSMPLLSSLALALSSLSPLSLLSPSMPLSLTNLGKLLRHAGACGDKVPKCFKHVHGKFGGGGTGAFSALPTQARKQRSTIWACVTCSTLCHPSGHAMTIAMREKATFSRLTRKYS